MSYMASSVRHMNTPLLAARVAPEVVAQLDALAAQRGSTRSDVIREALALILSKAKETPAP